MLFNSLALFLGVCTTTLALRHIPHFPKYLSAKEISINPKDYPACRIEIPVDHYNSSDTRTYSNRYWLNSKYYRSGGPVFYFDSGEQNAHPLVPYFLYEAAGPSSVMALARRFNGLAVLFEHRFYGDSMHGSFPFPMKASGMAEGGYSAYKYLTTEQALQDPVYFAHHFEPPGLEMYWSLLKPEYTPWIWLGGSYPGRSLRCDTRCTSVAYALFRYTWRPDACPQSRDFLCYLGVVRSNSSCCRYVDVLCTGRTEYDTKLLCGLYARD